MEIAVSPEFSAADNNDKVITQLQKQIVISKELDVFIRFDTLTSTHSYMDCTNFTA